MPCKSILSPCRKKKSGIIFELSFKILILKETGKESTKVRPGRKQGTGKEEIA